MKCRFCSKPTVVRRRLNMDTHSISFEYNHCEKCHVDYDDMGNDIILKGNGYILKKDLVDPME